MYYTNKERGKKMENNTERAEEKVLTIRDVLGITIKGLESISIPAALMEMPPEAIMAFKRQVINPIAEAKRNLIVCIQAFDQDEAQQKDRQRAEEQEKQKALAEGMDPEDEEIIDGLAPAEEEE